MAAGPCLPIAVLAMLAMVQGGCGSTLYQSMKAVSPRPPADAFDCVKAQIAAVGYAQDSIDVEARRINARKYDWTAREADTQFRRIVERLAVEIVEAPSGGSELRVGAHTFAELATQRGPTEVERTASAGVKAAAEAIVAACGN
jgi:hypothetical protein